MAKRKDVIGHRSLHLGGSPIAREAEDIACFRTDGLLSLFFHAFASDWVGFGLGHRSILAHSGHHFTMG